MQAEAEGTILMTALWGLRFRTPCDLSGDKEGVRKHKARLKGIYYNKIVCWPGKPLLELLELMT